jgi:hypothetical protein
MRVILNPLLSLLAAWLQHTVFVYRLIDITTLSLGKYSTDCQFTFPFYWLVIV